MIRIALPRRFSPEQLRRVVRFTKAQKERLAGLTIRKELLRTKRDEFDALSQQIREYIASPDFRIEL